MRKTLSTILFLASLAASAAATVRPRVPTERSMAALGVSLDERPATVTVGLLALNDAPLSMAPQPVTLAVEPTSTVPPSVAPAVAPATVGPLATELGVAPADVATPAKTLAASLTAALSAVGPQAQAFSASLAAAEPQITDFALVWAGLARPMAPFASSPLAPAVGVRAMTTGDTTARLAQSEALDGGEIDGGRFIRLVLSCEDDPALRDLLAAAGLRLRVTGQGPGQGAGDTRKLPEFFTAVACNSRLEFSREDAEALKKIASPGGIRVLRFVDRSGAAADYAEEHPDEKYIVIAEPSGLSIKALKALAGANTVAVVVGHYQAADVRPEDYPATAQETLAAVKAIRMVSDAPVLLAVSATNVLTRRTEKSWPESFGADLGGFDGWAIYNLAQFPAILEAPSNPRTLVLERLGLAEKPCLLIEFMGTRDDYKPADADYIRKVWKAKAPALLKALSQQKWHGLIVWSANIDDAALKAEALKSIPAR